MTVLVAFATIEGQTGKIAGFVDELVREAGQETELVDTSERTTDVSFDNVDKVILAAPVHERKHPKPFEVFLSGHASELADREVLLLSVSLSAAFPEGMKEAHEYVVEMKMRTGLDPTAEVLVGGAIRTHRYDYYAQQVLRHVVLRGRDYDPGQSEHEFTDWDAIRMEVTRFLG
ncbi:MAG: protoporphyrinogen oxidase [Silicimonas sp.]|nr:protoporphyrinogen oxidase [Silicimonas sp.]